MRESEESPSMTRSTNALYRSLLASRDRVARVSVLTRAGAHLDFSFTSILTSLSPMVTAMFRWAST